MFRNIIVFNHNGLAHHHTMSVLRLMPVNPYVKPLSNRNLRSRTFPKTRHISNSQCTQQNHTHKAVDKFIPYFWHFPRALARLLCCRCMPNSNLEQNFPACFVPRGTRAFVSTHQNQEEFKFD